MESKENNRSTETLMPEVYSALRQLALHRIKQQRPGQTISGTELVHEVYLRLQKEGSGPKWANQHQFFSAAAEAMRRILIDRIRSKERVKRGGGRQRLDLDHVDLAMPAEDQKLVEISEALDELAKSDPQSADLVKQRFFAGMTLEQIAEVSGVSVRTVTRRWTYARAWLAEYLNV
ncbi:MAG: ECF-type sigma factor [Planctomycetota bacterium]